MTFCRDAYSTEALLSGLQDHEATGVPEAAGRAGQQGFDLVSYAPMLASHLQAVLSTHA